MKAHGGYYCCTSKVSSALSMLLLIFKVTQHISCQLRSKSHSVYLVSISQQSHSAYLVLFIFVPILFQFCSNLVPILFQRRFRLNFSHF